MSSRLQAIKARLAAATPGPWRAMCDGNQYIEAWRLTPKLVGASRVDGLVRPWNPYALVAFGFKPEEYETARFLDADAALIAHAPADLQALLAVAEAAAPYFEQLGADATEYGDPSAIWAALAALGAGVET
jgi:hypothetical protein